MQRLLPVLMLCLLPLGASAQSLYKCRIDGTLTYSGSPCPGVSSTAVEVPPPVKAEAGTEPDLKKMQADATKLQKERNAKEQSQAKLDQAAARLAESKRQRCGKLRLQKKWADEAVAAGSASAKDKATEKARRLGDQLQLECPF
ncbi:DUF4124 domain-containing protein [Massilia sp. CF038]|uniref:DUF4124 domain-containing protein n=1 Tax=Massilia sp. CF038 TaxID=1881045 RepID=UPI00090ED3A3|nr:DUF4124 domain-containing protein [Massilia sp. CF038]SHG96198.1 protein of unknown function [Massilia sp. CF038]